MDAVVLALLVCGAGLVHVDDNFVAGARGRAIDDLACELWIILVTVYSDVGSGIGLTCVLPVLVFGLPVHEEEVGPVGRTSQPFVSSYQRTVSRKALPAVETIHTCAPQPVITARAELSTLNYPKLAFSICSKSP